MKKNGTQRPRDMTMVLNVPILPETLGAKMFAVAEAKDEAKKSAPRASDSTMNFAFT